MSADDDARAAAIRDRLADVLDPEPSPEELALVTRLLRSFAAKTPAAVDRLSELLAGGDLGLVREQAHSMKGSAANIGADALAALCATLEDQARDGAIPDPSGTAERIRVETVAALRAASAVADGYDSAG